MMKATLRLGRTAALVGLLVGAFSRAEAVADVIFTDNFNSGASALWGNEVGNWSASGGVYKATAPNNFPNAHSTLPFNLTDFTFDVDVNNVTDGGIWLRATNAPGTSVGIKGVLLVTGAGATGGTGLYFHVVPDGSTYGSFFDVTPNLFAAGSNPHLHVVVAGNTYQAFVNGASTPALSLTTSAFSSGRVALYDNSGQSFDNVVLATSVPEPSPLALAGFAAAVGSGVQWYRRRRTG